MTDTPNDTAAQIGPQPLVELVEAATAAQNELAAAGRYSEPVCTRLESALKAFPAAWSEPDQIATDAYLARFPADQRATADRAYTDGFADGGAGGFDLDRADVATILAALRYYQANGQGDPDNRSADIHDIATDGDAVISLDADGIDDLCERLNVQPPSERPDPVTLESMIANGLTFGEVLNAFGERQREQEPHLTPYADAVRNVGLDDQDFDIDGDPIVSKGDDAGAYVLVWRWVRDDEAGVEGEKSYAVWAKPNGPLTGAEPDIYDLDGALARVGAHRDLFLKAVKTEGGYEDPFFYAEEHIPEGDD